MSKTLHLTSAVDGRHSPYSVISTLGREWNEKTTETRPSKQGSPTALAWNSSLEPRLGNRVEKELMLSTVRHPPRYA